MAFVYLHSMKMKSVNYFPNTIRTLFALFTSILLGSCNKNPSIPINPDIKAKFNYQPGTYWVYRDTLGTEIDSFAVISNTLQNSNVLADAAFMNITRYNLSLATDTTLLRSTLSRNYLQTYALGTTINYPFAVGIIKSGGYVQSVDNTYTINGQTFTGLAEVVRTILTPDVYIDTFYINAEVGIVQIKEYRKLAGVESNKVLALQKWNVVR